MNSVIYPLNAIKVPVSETRCSCGKGYLIKTVSPDGKYTDIMCSYPKCRIGWHIPNYKSSMFLWEHPDFKPVNIVPNPAFAHYRNSDHDKDLDWEEVEEVEESSKELHDSLEGYSEEP